MREECDCGHKLEGESGLWARKRRGGWGAIGVGVRVRREGRGYPMGIRGWKQLRCSCELWFGGGWLTQM